jgi:hypothetical protein
MKNQLVRYYLNQAGRGSPNGGMVPIYTVQPFIQRGHGTGSLLSNFFRLVRPMLRSGVKALGRESLRTGGKILSDIAETDRKPSDIIAKHVGESAHNLIQKLRVRGRKLPALRRIPSTKLKKIKLIKRDNFT